ncbi:MAG: type II toxin-antitoxin system prevent-host-death family antitoxin [bacterium]
MKTITAKNLRDNLDEIVKRVSHGESIRVTYRSKAAFLIQPDSTEDISTRPGSQVAMQNFINQVREINKLPRSSVLNVNKPVKELYHELLDRDPKYTGSYE